MAALRLVHSAAWQACVPAPTGRFNSRDLMALHRWMSESDEHGYRRMLIEPGEGDLPEDGCFALLFSCGRASATWGVARWDDHVTVWRCGTGADLGRFDSMHQALTALPHPDGWPPRVREPIPTPRAALI